ncbi:BamA/TamA family outer membrane protein [Mucilaginibacter myungsuensis]|uniref:BamA/TamA family outer membrane protein n=1 Tax=Mucilaginibacter myungsuensis TaxID=649104 RepID=A0A929L343_9SPHI|nr:BamA/TamA family outer membrane protein [Mucilaginibacter myungsuensis]MBE9663584.1 BamA/TamA family outer membrane protein [Mucilaginibacter myungsuensis]MDN3599092.1 BamA/TamA family outer membrane protein [Mucilaginibacter myungsuensis]
MILKKVCSLPQISKYSIATSALLLWAVAFCLDLNAQAPTDTTRRKDQFHDQVDFNDVKAALLGKETKPDTSSFSKLRKLLIPSMSVNPTSGFEVGLTLAALKVFGEPDSTSLSTGSLKISAATKGLAYIQYKHNIYFPENQWSLQGNWQVGRTQVLDYGIGTGRSSANGSDHYVNGQLVDDSYKLKYTSFRFRETAYKKIFDNFYGGLGLTSNIYTGIDEDSQGNIYSYHYRYNTDNEIPTQRYLANSFSFNLQYDTRDHPNQPYEGIYADMGVKSYKKAIGSTENSTQLTSEFRKYIGLSTSTPQHVLAFWYWGSYLLSGRLPYLELPGTTTDNDERTGRAYTVGRFKGYSFFYSEAEYRFPILDNKFISGVAFANVQSASNGAVKDRIKLFQHWEPGAGVGLRILYNKYTRSNICVDYGIGNYGAKGLFVSLNEAF